MAITTLAQLASAQKQIVTFKKTTGNTYASNKWLSQFNESSGLPGAGTLAGTSTTAGVVPTDATDGTPAIDAFGSGNKGYISQIEYGFSQSTQGCRLALFDLLFKAGEYNQASDVSLSSQPSYSSRIPGGTDYVGTQIWVEYTSNSSGNLSVAVTYTDQSGNTGHSTGTISLGGNNGIRQLFQLPLASGDNGVRTIENVVGSVATTATFNILVLRPLWMGFIPKFNNTDIVGPALTGFTEIFADSALYLAVSPDGSVTALPELNIEIANG